jgi:hypothetical protein
MLVDGVGVGVGVGVSASGFGSVDAGCAGELVGLTCRGCIAAGMFSRFSRASRSVAQAPSRAVVAPFGGTAVTYPTVTVRCAARRRYHSTTGSAWTILTVSGRNRTVRTLFVIAVGILSLNQTAMGLPLALLAVIVSVSCEPCVPLRVHRRSISKPFPYRCSGKAYEAMGCGLVAEGGPDGDRVTTRPMTVARTATAAARERRTGRERVRDRRRVRPDISRPVSILRFRFLASVDISPWPESPEDSRFVPVAASLSRTSGAGREGRSGGEFRLAGPERASSCPVRCDEMASRRMPESSVIRAFSPSVAKATAAADGGLVPSAASRRALDWEVCVRGRLASRLLPEPEL